MSSMVNVNNLCMGCMTIRSSEDEHCSMCEFDKEEYKPAPHLLRPNTILNGKYLVGRVLGEGGFGITYIGWDLNLEIKIAVKEYYPTGFVTRDSTSLGSGTVAPLTGDKGNFYEQGLERFIREAKSLAKFYNLPGIVSVKDFFRENGTAYIVMEFVDGVTLKEYLRQCGGKMDPIEVLSIMKPLIKSLNTIHKEGIIHRDISPDNIMVSGAGEIKLIDFGAARDFSGEGNKSLSVLLKPGYAPEEQYRTKGNQGPWTDVYALCATMYKILTGQTPPESLERYTMDSIERPSALGVAISIQAEDAIIKGLSLFQKDRFQTVLELSEALYGVTRADQTQLSPEYNQNEQNLYSNNQMNMVGNQNQTGQYQENQTGQYQENQTGQYQENQTGQYQENQTGQYQENQTGQYQENQTGQYQENQDNMNQNYTGQNYIEQSQTKQKKMGHKASKSKKMLFVCSGIAVALFVLMAVFYIKNRSIDAGSSLCFYGEKGLAVNLKGKATKRISTNNCWDIVVENGWIYYSNYDDNGYLYKIKTDGKEGGRISRDSCGNLWVVDDTIYFSNGSDGYTLYKIGIDGTRKEKVSDIVCIEMQIENEYIYYTELGADADNYNICKMEIDGENPQVIGPADSAIFAINEGDLYYANPNVKGISSLHKDRDEPSEVIEDEVINMFAISDDNIFYGTAEGIYKTSTTGGGSDCITEDIVVAMDAVYEGGQVYKTESNIYVDGDWVYYWNQSDHGYLYKIKTDGTGRKCISKEASIYGRIQAVK